MIIKTNLEHILIQFKYLILYYVAKKNIINYLYNLNNLIDIFKIAIFKLYFLQCG
jgi:hypothetical protein